MVLGKFLGVCEVSIDELTFYVLTDSGRVVQRKSVWALTDDEEKIMEIEINNLEVLIAQKIGDSLEENEVDESARATLPTIPEQLFDTGDDVPCTVCPQVEPVGGTIWQQRCVRRTL